MEDSIKTTILIVDDEAAIRQSFTDFLEDHGYHTLAACNGRESIERYSSNEVDLVLVDLRMPEMDGIEVLSRIAADDPDMPLIVVSGTGVVADAADALRKGAWDYLLKPVEDLSILLHAVENAIEKSRLRRENREYQVHLERLVEKRTEELAQARDHLEQINKRLRRVVATTRTLSFCTEVSQFGSLLLEEFGRHMFATGGSLYLREGDGLRLFRSLDPGHARPFISLPIDTNNVFKKAIEEKKPLLIHDVTKEPGLVESGWENYGDGSALIFPLPDENGEIDGILALHSRNPPPFLDQDREIGSILASYGCEALRAVRAAETLRENERQFRMILDTVQTGVIIVDPGSKRLLYMNPAADRMIGRNEADLSDQDREASFCSDNPWLCLDAATNSASSSERIMRTRDRKEMAVLHSAAPIRFLGTDCYLENFIDLSAIKRANEEKAILEAQLRQAQKMEALGTLAGGIAHDFNNILGAVIGFAELGKMQLESEDDPLVETFQSILNAGERARELVSQILTFSRMHEHILTPIRLEPIISEAFALLRGSLQANVEMRMLIESDDRVMADPTQIHQIVMNLCTNALHAMEERGGTMTVSLTTEMHERPLRFANGELSPGKYLVMTVADEGIGIDPSLFERIFEPYFTTKKRKGTGLGLAVVHGIVKGHGGEIMVRSRPGKGTEFHVFLPVSTETDASGGKAWSVMPPGTERILFIDHEPTLADVMSRMLARLGYRVDGVTRGLDGLARIENDPSGYDLVVTDVDMPDITGDRLIDRIRRIRADLPVVLCTGSSDQIDQAFPAHEGRVMLLKPLSIRKLARTIRNVLDGRKGIG